MDGFSHSDRCAIGTTPGETRPSSRTRPVIQWPRPRSGWHGIPLAARPRGEQPLFATRRDYRLSVRSDIQSGCAAMRVRMLPPCLLC